jgi:predicted nucleotidyltransferase
MYRIGNIYGSRARGDNSERSDWDLAIESDKEISAFMLDLKDESPTLCGVDIVFLPNASKELKSVVTKEGKMIYEQ